MEQIQFDVQLRKNIGTAQAQRVRRANSIPAVIYGGGAKPATIQADRKAYDRIHRLHMGESLIYHLNVVDNGKKVADFPAIIKEVQMHPVTEEVIHIDFNRISLDREIEIKVKVITKGEAIGIKRDGGTLDHSMWELDIICLPTNIPHHIEVDITQLGIHDAVHVRELVLPAGVRTKHDPDSVVAAVVGSTKEVIAEAAVEGTPAAEPEVLKEKKKEEPVAEAGTGKKAEPAKKEEKK